MKMRLMMVVILLLGGLLGWGVNRFSGTPVAAGAAVEKTLYTCGMHPQIIQDHPGNCPICGMKMTPVRRQAVTAGVASGASAPSGAHIIKYYKSTMIPGEVKTEPGKDSMGMDMVPVYADEAALADANVIAIDPVTVQNMGIRTALVTRGPLRRIIRTVGIIEYSEPALAEVTTKAKGWIDKLYVDSTGQQVHRGEPLFDFYAPEYYSAQAEYVQALGAGGGEALQQSAARKLKFFDFTDAQIAALEQSRTPQKTVPVLAPADGVVVEKLAVVGQMVEAGMRLYRLADLGLVWVQAQIYERDLAFVKLGQEATVTLSYLPDRTFRGRVTYVYPNVDEKTRTAKVRMEFHNPGYFLKPGMFAEVQLAAELELAALLAPEMAVLRSGEQNTVFVARDGGRFDPRAVKLGATAEDGMVQILDGLKEGERIVTSGQFMLDSESQLREAIQKMLKPTQSNSLPSAQPSTLNHQPSPVSSVVKYVCPMPDHISIVYDHAGPCPLCGMALVPVNSADLAKLPPGGKLQYYTCPMPEHANVHEAKPGKCPLCGMTLIPVMSAPPAAKAATPALYTYPMASHAHVVSDKPGLCPECEMQLMPTSTVAHGKQAEAEWYKLYPQEKK